MADRFFKMGSPLDGKRIPYNWKSLDLVAKRKVLVERGIARNYSDACSILARHGAAARRYRKAQRGVSK